MNCFPNSTNNLFSISLKTITYPDDDFESYYLTHDDIAAIYQEGKLPFITLPEENREEKPVIAVILAQEKFRERKEKDYSIHPDYVSAVVNAGGYPVFIAYDNVKEQLEAINPDGILLIGGCFNVPKEWYANPPAEDIDRRGQAYLDMIAYAQEHKLPTLGICGGHQVMSGFCGGMLRHSINNAVSPEKSHKQGGYVLAHKVNITAGSLLHNIVGTTEIMVNTAHNEAVCKNVPGVCYVTGLAPDGVVEAIEPKKPWNKFVLGVQWHPERLAKLGDEASLKIFQAFIKEASRGK